MLLRSMALALKYGVPLSLVVVPAIVGSDLVFPDNFERVAHQAYAGQLPLLVGYDQKSSSGMSQQCQNTGPCGPWQHYSNSLDSRTYLILRPTDGQLKIATIKSVDGGQAAFSEQNTTPAIGLWFAAWLLFCGASIWWFWFKL
jgi:hypothetical protein